MRSILLLQLVEFAARLRYVPVVVRDFREFGLSSNREAFELVEKKLEQIHSKNFRGWSFRWQRNRLTLQYELHMDRRSPPPALLPPVKRPMNEQTKLVNIDAGRLEDDLSPLGDAGWSLVNCWPAQTAGMVTCVLCRQKAFYSLAERAWLPIRPLESLTPAVLLGCCLEEGTKMKGKKTRALRFERIAMEFGTSEDEAFAHLALHGMKEEKDAKDRPKLFTFLADHVVSVIKFPEKTTWVYASPLDQKSDPAVSSEKKPPAPVGAPVSLEAAISYCAGLAPKQPGYDHSASLASVAKHLGCKAADVLAAFRHHGLETDGQFQEIHGRLVALKAWNAKGREVYYLNVKPLDAKASKDDDDKIPLN
jgi:hypothetical protein